MRIKIPIIAVIFLLSLALFMHSCQREDKVTLAIVTVKNQDGSNISGATVRIFQDTIKNEQGVEAGISSEAITGAGGETIHALPDIEAILFVEAKKDTFRGLDIIRVNPFEENEKTVWIE